MRLIPLLLALLLLSACRLDERPPEGQPTVADEGEIREAVEDYVRARREAGAGRYDVFGEPARFAIVRDTVEADAAQHRARALFFGGEAPATDSLEIEYLVRRDTSGAFVARETLVRRGSEEVNEVLFDREPLRSVVESHVQVRMTDRAGRQREYYPLGDMPTRFDYIEGPVGLADTLYVLRAVFSGEEGRAHHVDYFLTQDAEIVRQRLTRADGTERELAVD
jgi:hypothetical protein